MKRTAVIFSPLGRARCVVTGMLANLHPVGDAFTADELRAFLRKESGRHPYLAHLSEEPRAHDPLTDLLTYFRFPSGDSAEPLLTFSGVRYSAKRFSRRRWEEDLRRDGFLPRNARFVARLAVRFSEELRFRRDMNGAGSREREVLEQLAAWGEIPEARVEALAERFADTERQRLRERFRRSGLRLVGGGKAD